MKRLSPQEIATFRKKVYAHQRQYPRSFPWSRTHDPYKILVSEIMLQQTQTHRVVPLYKNFLKRFPNTRSLANAQQKDVLLAWQGLGYNRRALNLQRAAQKIIAEFKGKTPENTEALISLPGVGPYTAAAVRAFAFKKPGVVIETNIRTVFIHEFFPHKKKVADTLLAPLIDATMDRRRPDQWYVALMGYGVTLKATHKNPSRRSAGYTRQSAFTGSDRALRGKILKLSLMKKRTLRELAKELAEPMPRIRHIVQNMTKEGFVRMRGEKVGIA